MNRAGHAPTFLLIVVALVVSGAALTVFLISGGETSDLSQTTSTVINEVTLSEAYIHSLVALVGSDVIIESSSGGDLKALFMDELSKRGSIDGAANFFGRVRNGDFSFSEGAEGYVFEMNGVFVSAQREGNKITRRFDVRVVFDREGNVLSV